MLVIGIRHVRSLGQNKICPGSKVDGGKKGVSANPMSANPCYGCLPCLSPMLLTDQCICNTYNTFNCEASTNWFICVMIPFDFFVFPEKNKKLVVWYGLTQKKVNYDDTMTKIFITRLPICRRELGSRQGRRSKNDSPEKNRISNQI